MNFFPHFVCLSIFVNNNLFKLSYDSLISLIINFYSFLYVILNQLFTRSTHQHDESYEQFFFVSKSLIEYDYDDF